MKPTYKLNDKVKLVNNIAGSSFKIGTIGYIHIVDESTSRTAKDHHIYLIRNENGKYDGGGTWSYSQDLQKMVLNKQIKTL